jgi:hypothetical protein
MDAKKRGIDKEGEKEGKGYHSFIHSFLGRHRLLLLLLLLLQMMMLLMLLMLALVQVGC